MLGVSWYDAIPYVEFALNSTVSATTGFAPFETWYGENVQLPIDHALHTPPHADRDAPNFVANIRRIVSETQQAMQRAQSYQKRYYDAHHTPKQFQVNDYVLLSTSNMRPVPGPHTYWHPSLQTTPSRGLDHPSNLPR